MIFPGAISPKFFASSAVLSPVKPAIILASPHLNVVNTTSQFLNIPHSVSGPSQPSLLTLRLTSHAVVMKFSNDSLINLPLLPRSPRPHS